MWKLFQSVLKTFRTQAIVPPCNRISTATQQQDSSTFNDDCETAEICGGATKQHISSTAYTQNETTTTVICRCYDPQITFPSIEKPSQVANNDGLSKQNKSVKFSLPEIKIIDSKTKSNASALKPEVKREVRPSLASLHDAMGVAALKADNKDLALQHLQIAANVFNSPVAHYNLGVLLQFHYGNPVEAARHYRLAGRHPDALYNLAYLTLHSPDSQTLMPRKAREKEALKLLKQAARLGSKEAENFLVDYEVYVSQKLTESAGDQPASLTTDLLSKLS